jgi:hypothetical protein
VKKRAGEGVNANSNKSAWGRGEEVGTGDD